MGYLMVILLLTSLSGWMVFTYTVLPKETKSKIQEFIQSLSK